MKEYRLLAWPELPAEYQRTAHRRALSEMSQRYMSLAKLVEVSGLKKSEMRNFVEMLDGRAVLAERDTTAPDSFLDSIRPLGWLRRAMHVEPRPALSRAHPPALRVRRAPSRRLSAFPWRG